LSDVAARLFLMAGIDCGMIVDCCAMMARTGRLENVRRLRTVQTRRSV
jgi:hypothetical protein